MSQRSVFLTWILLAIAGCGGGPELAPVQGKVLMDGAPLKFGVVIFQRTTGGQPSRGEIQPDGSFFLSTFKPEDGALVGKHQVRVLCYTGHRDGIKGDSLGQLLIPPQYTSFSNSGLTATVSPGDNPPLTLELSSGKKRR